MKKLLSVIVAAAFAAVSAGAIAQSKDVTTKKGGEAIPSKGGPNVTTKDMKEKPKPAPRKARAAPKPKEKVKGGPVTTKSGGDVSSKDKKGVTTKDK